MTGIPSLYDDLADSRAAQTPQDPPPDPQQNPYDAILDRRQQQADQYRVASFNTAVKSNPDAAAEAQRIAKQLGLPSDVAERNLDEVRAISAQRDYENRNLAAFSPILDRQLRDPEFARIAHDDLDRLSTWEGMVRGFDIGKLETEQGFLGERLRSGTASQADIDRLAAVRSQLEGTPRPKGFLAGSAKIVGQQAVTIPKALEVGLASSIMSGGVALGLGQAGPQAFVPEEVVTVPAAMISGLAFGTTGALAVQAYQMEAGSAYLDMIDRGYDKTTASRAAVGVGIANAALEIVGVKLLAKGAGITSQALREAIGAEVRQGVSQALVRPTLGHAALQFAKGYGTGLGGEVVTETMQEGVNIVAEEIARRFSENPTALESTVTRGEIVQRLVDTALQTAEGMALLAAPGPTMHLWRDQRRAAEAAERQLQQLRGITNGAIDSKVRQRSPADFEKFAKEAVAGTGAENVFIDAQVFDQVLRQADLEAGEKGTASAADTLRAMLPDVMQQAAEAMRTGGDVVIPTEQFAARIAGTPLAEKLLPHLRSDVEAMSLAEAQVFRQGEEERSAEAQKILQQQETENRAFVEQAQQVEETLRQQLGQTGKMAAAEAVAAAKFYRDIVVTQASRAGMLPAEFVAKYPLRVLAEELPPAASVQQQTGDGVDAEGPGQDDPKGEQAARPAPDGDASGTPVSGDRGAVDPVAGAEEQSPRRLSRSDVSGIFAARTELARQYGRQIGVDRVTTVDEAAQALSYLGSGASERLDALVTDKDGRPLAIVGGFKGGLAEVTVNLPALILDAFRVDGAAQIWLAHNHPSGSIDLSMEDRNMLRRIEEAFRGSEIRLRGLFAIGAKAASGRRWMFEDADSGAQGQGATRASSVKVEVPFAERELSTEGRLGPPVRGAAELRALVSKLDPDAPGMLLFDRRNAPVAFVPVTPGEVEILRSSGRVDALYRAIGVANAGKAVIVKQGGLSEDETANLLRFLNSIDIEVLDVAEIGDRGVRLVSERHDSYGDFREVLRGAGRSFASGARGSYRPSDFTIFLHKKADASTFLHELAHHYLHVLADLASRPDAAPTIVADMQQLLKWFGVDDLAAWNALTLEQQRSHHEAFAYSFELYLFEGKAPSQAMEGLFARFARWLRRAYTTIKGSLNAAYRKETGQDLPVLTPEVRGVMDRMAASEEEIAHQESVRGMVPQFATQAESGMTDAEWAAYQGLHSDQRDAATAQLTRDSLRQMQWLSNAKAGLLKRLQKQHDAVRKQVRDEVTTAIEQQPVYRAIAWLRDGPAAADGAQAEGGSHRLAADAVRKLLEGRQALQADAAVTARPTEPSSKPVALGGVWRKITEKKGLAPDLAASMLGFRTGEELVTAIADAPTLEAAIDAETDARMMAEHSELADPQKREQAVQAALHNETRTRFLAAELRHLTKATQPLRLMAQAAKSAATRILAGRPVGQIQPREHVVAEERARRASIQAMRRGESAVAGEQKRIELLQHHLAKQSIDARAEIDEALEQFEKVWDSDEKIGKARAIEHVAAARAILAHYGLGRGGKTPAQHMAQAHAYDSQTAQELQSMVDRLGSAAEKRTWRQVTLEEFRTMREAVEQLWFQARRANEMVVEGRRVKLAAAAGELAARLEALGLPVRAPGDRGTETDFERFRREGVLAGFASITRVEHWAEALGPAFVRYVFRPIADGLVNYRRDRNVYVRKYEELLRAHRDAGHLDRADIVAPELNGHVFHGKAELLGALFHAGNRSNLRKMVVGWRWAKWDDGPDSFDTSGWDAFLTRMIAKGVIGKADFDLAQAVWDMNEGLKPQLQETHRGLFGHYFEEVEASEIATQWGVYRGGYVPATADSTEQGVALQAQLAELQGDYRNVVPAVQRGFTKSRTDITRKLTLDIRQMAGHLDKVLRFAHVQPAVKDVLGVLKHRDLAGTLHRWNPVVMDKLLLPWLNRAASGLTTEPAKNKVVGRWLTKLRQNAGLAIMAGNVVNAAQNLAGILTARALVAGRDLRSSLFEVVGSPRESADRIAARSPFMADRMEGRIHELQDSIEEIARGRGWLGQANKLAAKYGYVLQKKTQGFVDQVVWIGAYNQAMREQGATVGDAEAEAAAVAKADSAVRRTQGSQEAEDVSAYETGTPRWKAFVQFGSWFNNNANLNVSEWVKLKRELGWRGVVGTRAGALALWGFLLPTLAASWIQQMLGAGWDDDDDDGMADEYVGWFFAAQARGLLASVPLAGSAALTAWNFLDDKSWNDRMPQPAVLSIPERGLKALMGLDDGATGSRVRDVLTFASALVGVPLSVAGRPAGYAMDVEAGKVKPTGPVDYVRGLVTGQASEASKR